MPGCIFRRLATLRGMIPRTRIGGGLALMMLLVATLMAVPIHGGEHPFPPAWLSLALMVASGFATWRVAGRAWGLTVLVVGAIAALWVEFSRSPEMPNGHVLPGFLFAISTVISAAAITHGALGKRVRGEDRVYHGITSYLLIALAFAAVQHRVAILDPSAFRIPDGGQGKWVDFLWLSFSTLTTAGFGDVVPVSSWARLACTLEAVTGVMFPAIFIARLVTEASEDEGLAQ